VGIVMVASSPIRVAPAKGTLPVVGTNPICIGLPTEPLPFIGDSATSEITHGTLLLARSSGEALPSKSAVGSDGQPATSAARVHPTQGQGALLPFGGHYKAFALSMGIELLVSLGGGLPGSDRQDKNGVFCLFLSDQFFSSFLPSMSEWLLDLDQRGVRIPGWISGRQALAQQQRGIVNVPAETFSTLESFLPNDISASSKGRSAT
jgi:LDH2 family malate/lactate/ureidoglycolate dehydrogenase